MTKVGHSTIWSIGMTKLIGNHPKRNIEKELTEKEISLSSITARVNTCRHQTKNDIFLIEFSFEV
jgi:hypothetical protein